MAFSGKAALDGDIYIDKEAETFIPLDGAGFQMSNIFRCCY